MQENPFKGVLKLAVDSRASDIHIKTGRTVTLRISTKLVESDLIADKDSVASFIKILLNQDMEQKYHTAGDVDLSYAEEGIGRFRVNIHKQRGETTIAMRHVKSRILNFQELGLPPQIKKLTEFERGIVFLTGTTGSGKSTTLASIIESINQTMKRHIITIEDPIEYEFTDKESFIEQREVGLDTISFDSAVIHSLRQDPDIVVIGEMRSRESFDAALKAADTGHLVFSTLHTKNAPQSVGRILDFYETAEHPSIRHALGYSLAAVVSQRLIARVAGDGVIPAVEIMFNNAIIQSLLRENKLDKLAPAIEGSKGEGMQSFNQSIMDLINNGLISEDDALKSSDNPEALKMYFKGVFLRAENKILG